MDPQQLKDKYIGDQKITEVTIQDAEGKVTVTLEDGKKYENILLTVIQEWVTENPKDATDLRELIVVPMVVEIITMMSKSQFKLEYYDYLQMKLKATIDQNADKAQDILWGKDKGELTLTDIEKILTKQTS